MKLKSESIMKTLKANGKVTMKMDRESGFHQLTVTKMKSCFAVGEHPGGKVRRFTEADVFAMLDDMPMFIEKWW